MKYDIRETTFAPRTYLVWRKEIDIRNIADREMWQSAFVKVHEYIQRNGLKTTGPAAALYFRWDQAAGKAELGIGNPVEGADSTDDPELTLESVPESNASFTTVKGDYEQLPEVHGQLIANMSERSLHPTLTVEEYAVTAIDKPDPKDWETNVYYLHD